MKLKQSIKKFHQNQSAIGTLEVMLIIAVVIILFIIFREFIVDVVDNLVNNAEEDIEKYAR